MEIASPTTSLRTINEIEEKKEWRMCPRCPHRLADLANHEKKDKKEFGKARNELAKMGFLSAEEMEILLGEEGIIDRSGSVTPTQRAFTPRQPVTPAPTPKLENKKTFLLRDIEDGVVIRNPKLRTPAPDEAMIIPEREAPRNPCEEIGCQSSYFSDDSSDEEALKVESDGEGEGDSPSKMLMKTMSTLRRRVVRAFSGSEAAARVRSASEVERKGDGGELERFMSGAPEAGKENMELSREMARIGVELERRVTLEGQVGGEGKVACRGRHRKGSGGGDCRGHQRGGDGKPGGSCEF